MENLKFEEYKDKILAALQSKFKAPGNFTVIDGFVYAPIQKETKSFQIGGQSIPQVAVVNTDTAEIHYFALKVLMPDIKI